MKGALLNSEPRSLKRRAQEMVLASRVETALTKDEILERYLNRVYFGGDVWGIRAASRRYFGVEPRDLTVAQAATLAAMTPAPNAMRQSRAFARTRRDWVLARMREQGFLTASARDAALAEPL